MKSLILYLVILSLLYLTIGVDMALVPLFLLWVSALYLVASFIEKLAPKFGLCVFSFAFVMLGVLAQNYFASQISYTATLRGQLVFSEGEPTSFGWIFYLATYLILSLIAITARYLSKFIFFEK